MKAGGKSNDFRPPSFVPCGKFSSASGGIQPRLKISRESLATGSMFQGPIWLQEQLTRDSEGRAAMQRRIHNPMASTSRRAPAGRRILFAEDHPQARGVMEAYLTDAGYVVHAAPDGTDALELFRRNLGEYDVIITDHEMPGHDGVELVQKLREACFPGKIIVVTGELTPEIEQAYTSLGVDRILTKPIKYGTLIRLIQELCEALQSS